MQKESTHAYHVLHIYITMQLTRLVHAIARYIYSTIKEHLVYCNFKVRFIQHKRVQMSF